MTSPQLTTLTSDYLAGKNAKRSGIPYTKRVDDGLAILKWLKLDTPSTVDAWAILNIMVTCSMHPTLCEEPIKIFSKYPRAYKLARQCHNIVMSYDTSSYDLVPIINLEILNTGSNVQIKAILCAYYVSCYVDFCISEAENVFSEMPPGFVANRIEFFNTWLAKLDVDESNFEYLRECVSRDYPWS